MAAVSVAIVVVVVVVASRRGERQRITHASTSAIRVTFMLMSNRTGKSSTSLPASPSELCVNRKPNGTPFSLSSYSSYVSARVS